MLNTHVLHVGSNANNAGNAGMFTTNANNGSDNRNQNNGSHLAEDYRHCFPSYNYVSKYDDSITLGSESEQREEHQQYEKTWQFVGKNNQL